MRHPRVRPRTPTHPRGGQPTGHPSGPIAAGDHRTGRRSADVRHTNGHPAGADPRPAPDRPWRAAQAGRPVAGDWLCALGPTAASRLLDPTPPDPGAPFCWPWAALTLPSVWVLTLAATGGYRRRRLRRERVAVRPVAVAGTVFLGLVAVLCGLAPGPTSAVTVAVVPPMAAVLTLLYRRAWRRRARSRRAAERHPHVSRAPFEDRLLAALIILLALPVLVVAAIAVRASGGGPVFVREPLTDHDGRRHPVLRFRTTVSAPLARGDASVDVRLTPAGRLLHRLALDDLPRLLDVVRGEVRLLPRRTGGTVGNPGSLWNRHPTSS
ncbi:sugar transferase [Geodermatophilus sp. CPCC 205506]|uniref:sugar transferase n=1 Tax=Geodermatophilus sp. CPCC 205506 TaxID=2936596 RepID=UPI003EEB5F9A